MRSRSKVSMLIAALAVTSACGPRQVEVRTAPATAAQQSVRVVNNLSQAVNIYVVTGSSTSGGGELFLLQVAPNTAKEIPVPNVASGAQVTFKAVTVDGSRTYQSRNVTLAGLYPWSIP